MYAVAVAVLDSAICVQNGEKVCVQNGEKEICVQLECVQNDAKEDLENPQRKIA